MKALQSLTELFTAYVTDAKNVNIWAEDGELVCTQGGSIDGFEIKYTVNIDMSKVALAPQILMMHLVNWLNLYDVQRGEKGLPNPSFATELLDNGRCDIKLKIDMQEAYSLVEHKDGNWSIDGVRYECVSDFSQTVDADDLPMLLFVNGTAGDLPPC
ncbi:hypothetical protein JI57_03875 [Psychromonas sp. PRT-SC03]|nr:hypothetical protein JI57_03875 [Psychromonas sp. PRT-SC03]